MYSPTFCLYVFVTISFFLTSPMRHPIKWHNSPFFQYAPCDGAGKWWSLEIRLWRFTVCELWDLPLTRRTEEQKDRRTRVLKSNTKALNPSTKCTTCTQIFAPLSDIPLVKESACFYCHLTLFVRNKLIYRGFKSVRWFQSILHSPAYILHILPRCLAVNMDVCSR